MLNYQRVTNNWGCHNQWQLRKWSDHLSWWSRMSFRSFSCRWCRWEPPCFPAVSWRVERLPCSAFGRFHVMVFLKWGPLTSCHLSLKTCSTNIPRKSLKPKYRRHPTTRCSLVHAHKKILERISRSSSRALVLEEIFQQHHPQLPKTHFWATPRLGWQQTTPGHVAIKFPDSVSAVSILNSLQVSQTCGLPWDRKCKCVVWRDHLHKCMFQNKFLEFAHGEILWWWSTNLSRFINVSRFIKLPRFTNQYPQFTKPFPFHHQHWRMMHDWMGSWLLRRPRSKCRNVASAILLLRVGNFWNWNNQILVEHVYNIYIHTWTYRIPIVSIPV